MADSISKELFAHLVHLAALELSPEESAYLRSELNNQLHAIDELASISIDSIFAITSHGVPYTPESTPPLRNDEWIPNPGSETLLSLAPISENGYIIVPEIPHSDLE